MAGTHLPKLFIFIFFFYLLPAGSSKHILGDGYDVCDPMGRCHSLDTPRAF